jgi:hypothetical protein
MRLPPIRLSFLLALFLVVPVLAADDDETKPKDENKPKKGKQTPTLKFLAKLVKVNKSSKILTVELHQPIVVANNHHIRNVAHWQRKLVEAGRVKKPQDRAKRIAEAQNHIAFHEARSFQVKDKHQNVDLQAVEDLQVRTMVLPPAYDDKGNPRKHTADELKELKGPNKDLPGYTADFSDLKGNLIVEITIGQPKNTGPKGPSSSSSASKTDDKEPGPEKPADSRPKVVMVVIAQ